MQTVGLLPVVRFVVFERRLPIHISDWTVECSLVCSFWKLSARGGLLPCTTEASDF